MCSNARPKGFREKLAAFIGDGIGACLRRGGPADALFFIVRVPFCFRELGFVLVTHYALGWPLLRGDSPRWGSERPMVSPSSKGCGDVRAKGPSDISLGHRPGIALGIVTQANLPRAPTARFIAFDRATAEYENRQGRSHHFFPRILFRGLSLRLCADPILRSLQANWAIALQAQTRMERQCSGCRTKFFVSLVCLV